MRLRNVKGIGDYISWLQSKGITPSQNSKIGRVDMVHTSTSLHYRENHGNGIRLAPNSQGDLAIDVNDNDVGDDNFAARVFSESTALKIVFYRTKRMAKRKHWCLNEMFFADLGFMKEYGYGVNHPVSGHSTHLHVGFDNETF